MEIRRGDLVVAVFPGDYGKPRPALVIQSNAFDQLPSLTVLPLTSDFYPTPLVRVGVAPSPSNGLDRQSHVMIDKATTVAKARIGQRIGQLEPETMRQVGTALARFLDIG